MTFRPPHSQTWLGPQELPRGHFCLSGSCSLIIWGPSSFPGSLGTHISTGPQPGGHRALDLEADTFGVPGLCEAAGGPAWRLLLPGCHPGTGPHGLQGPQVLEVLPPPAPKVLCGGRAGEVGGVGQKEEGHHKSMASKLDSALSLLRYYEKKSPSVKPPGRGCERLTNQRAAALSPETHPEPPSKTQKTGVLEPSCAVGGNVKSVAVTENSTVIS